MRFSKSTGCFYPDDIHYPNPPADLIDVAADDYTTAMNRAAGETLDVVDGKLVVAPAPVPTKDELLAQAKSALSAAVQVHLDSMAQGLRYDSILSLCSYAASTNKAFAAQAKRAVAWRDEVWSCASSIEAAVLAGNRAIPTPEQLLAELPKFEVAP